MSMANIPHEYNLLLCGCCSPPIPTNQGRHPSALTYANRAPTVQNNRKLCKLWPTESDNPELAFNELMGQAFGFTPRRLSEVYEANQAVTHEKDKLDLQRTRLLNKWVNAEPSDRTGVFNEEIKPFNQEHPTHRIDGDSLIKSIKTRRSHANQTQSGLYLPKKQQGLRELGNFAND